MNKYLCALICFLVGILIYLLIKSYCGCDTIVEGQSESIMLMRTGNRGGPQKPWWTALREFPDMKSSIKIEGKNAFAGFIKGFARANFPSPNAKPGQMYRPYEEFSFELGSNFHNLSDLNEDLPPKIRINTDIFKGRFKDAKIGWAPFPPDEIPPKQHRLALFLPTQRRGRKLRYIKSAEEVSQRIWSPGENGGIIDPAFEQEVIDRYIIPDYTKMMWAQPTWEPVAPHEEPVLAVSTGETGLDEEYKHPDHGTIKIYDTQSARTRIPDTDLSSEAGMVLERRKNSKIQAELDLLVAEYISHQPDMSEVDKARMWELEGYLQGTAARTTHTNPALVAQQNLHENETFTPYVQTGSNSAREGPLQRSSDISLSKYAQGIEDHVPDKVTSDYDFSAVDIYDPDDPERILEMSYQRTKDISPSDPFPPQSIKTKKRDVWQDMNFLANSKSTGDVAVSMEENVLQSQRINILFMERIQEKINQLEENTDIELTPDTDIELTPDEMAFNAERKEFDRTYPGGTLHIPEHTSMISQIHEEKNQEQLSELRKDLDKLQREVGDYSRIFDAAGNANLLSPGRTSVSKRLSDSSDIGDDPGNPGDDPGHPGDDPGIPEDNPREKSIHFDTGSTVAGRLREDGRGMSRHKKTPGYSAVPTITVQPELRFTTDVRPGVLDVRPSTAPASIQLNFRKNKRGKSILNLPPLVCK